VAARIETPEAPASSPRVDLNSASVADLNALGGGMIGRAIVGGRPYASPEDLLAKRVLNRATYERIKDQIAAN
jgi:DNA uptake protein ComE-like DNA-binding protein